MEHKENVVIRGCREREKERVVESKEPTSLSSVVSSIFYLIGPAGTNLSSFRFLAPTPTLTSCLKKAHELNMALELKRLINQNRMVMCAKILALQRYLEIKPQQMKVVISCEHKTLFGIILNLYCYRKHNLSQPT